MNRIYKNVPAGTLAQCLGAWNAECYELECRMVEYARIIMSNSIKDYTREVYASKLHEITEERDEMFICECDIRAELAYRRLQPFIDSISGIVTLKVLQ